MCALPTSTCAGTAGTWASQRRRRAGCPPRGTGDPSGRSMILRGLRPSPPREAYRPCRRSPSEQRPDAGGHLRLVLLVGAGDVAEQRAHTGEGVADPLRGHAPLLVELGETDGCLAVGPAV